MTSDYNQGPAIGWLTPPSPIVKRLMIINGMFFFIELLAAASDNGWLFFRDYLALSGKGLHSWRVWQFGTYMFLHDPHSIWHILFNLFALWMFGRDVEYDLGPRNFLKMYFAGGIVGGLVWIVFNFQTPGYVLGASGAILSVCIAYATLYPERPITMLLFLIIPITMKAKYWAWLTVVLVAYGCLAISSSVADLAHLGGILVGYLYVKWLGFGTTPTWVTWFQKAPSAQHTRYSKIEDEFHSARPGVPFNHPYRTFEQEESAESPKKKWTLGKLFSSHSSESEPEDIGKEEYIRKEIDPILDKIAKHGMQSLTRRERKILEDAREKIDNRS